MKFEVNKAELLKVLKTLLPITASKFAKAQPVLENFLFETSNGKLSITASDISIKGIAKISHGIDITDDGTMLVNAQKFTSIVETFDKAISIKKEETEIILSENKTKISLPLIQLKYPENILKSKIEYDSEFEINIKDFKEGLNKAFDFRKSITYDILSGVNIKTDNEKLKFCATDGNALAVYSAAIKKPYEEVNFTLSPAVCDLLLKNLANTGANKALIKISKKRVNIRFGNIIIESALLDGIFPKYEGIIAINDKPDKFLTIDKKQLFDCIKKVAAVKENTPSNDAKTAKSSAIRYYITLECGLITKINYSNKLEDYIPAEYGGENLSISFNPDYMLKVLKSCNNDRLTLEISTELGPIFVKEENLTALIMPVQGVRR